MAKASTEAIQPPADKHVKPALFRVFNESVQDWSAVLGPADASVYVLYGGGAVSHSTDGCRLGMSSCSSHGGVPLLLV